MEDIDLQIRAQQPLQKGRIAYPYSHDRRLQSGDQFRESKEQLEGSLAEIDRFYASSEAGPHDGPPNCQRCNKKKNDISRAFYNYYLSNDPRAWYAENLRYKQEMRRRFENPDTYTLDDNHSFFRSVLRDHLKQDLCTVLPTDDAKIASFKYKTSDFFNEGRSTEEILDAYLGHVSTIAPSPEAAAFNSALQDSTTRDERAQLYVKYYCSSSWNDSPAVKAIKTKHSRMFEALLPHDHVLALWRKDARDSQSTKLAELQGKLSDIKMAHSAYLKNKKKKAEKAEKDQRMVDREPARIEQCTLGGCPIEINLVTEEVIECAVCEWMDRKGGERGRAVYCSVEHANEDFEEHDRHDHRCMAERCIYHPKLGPPGNFTDALCFCQCCLEEDLVSMYCSQECYEENLADHQDQAYQRRGHHNHYEELEFFRPAEEMEIVS
ncbi:uncharacterized protein RSE6_11975 [Rhynchosporium secalis]|uniref:Uncharacterized protein n=1 Tax=Rhynchosporium secalis TaxID=38038 RepID=A0A1E1MQ80_RHYSE|nr:uncharacterized protein RSE6_11975 [Rhynchosporium secalis]